MRIYYGKAKVLEVKTMDVRQAILEILEPVNAVIFQKIVSRQPLKGIDSIEVGSIVLIREQKRSNGYSPGLIWERKGLFKKLGEIRSDQGRISSPSCGIVGLYDDCMRAVKDKSHLPLICGYTTG